MRISLWMLANRLYPLDIELHIREDAPIKLKSSRIAYATDCAHILKKGKDVICQAEGGYIRIPDMELSHAFEMIQSVFDYYNDWNDWVRQAAAKKDYQEIVDLCRQVFHNPMIFLDANCRVLGMSRNYTAEDIDKEWGYLLVHGYSSVDAVRDMKAHQKGYLLDKEGIKYLSLKGKVVENKAITNTLYYEGELCGRISVIEKNRELNPGDWQLLELISGWIKPVLGERSRKEKYNKNNSVFYRILSGEETDREELDRQLSYEGWDAGDSYQVFYIRHVIKPYIRTHREERWFDENIRIEFSRIFPFSRVLGLKEGYVILCNYTKHPSLWKEELRLFSGRKEICISYGYHFHGIRNICQSLRQAKSAMEYGKMLDPDKNVYGFYHYALYSLVESGDLSRSIFDCHPDIARLHKREKIEKDGWYPSLAAYLRHNGSLTHAADELYIHKNTLTYRIKKITEGLLYPIEDTYSRDYMRISTYILDLAQKRNAFRDIHEEQPL